jgi:hypothetical protein
MADDLELVARAEAFRRGRAVPMATHRRVAVQPDALVVCPLVLAGDDLQLHALGLGSIDGTLEVRSVADPRRWRDREPLFRWLHGRLEAYLMQCAARGSFPQLLVASDAAVSFLDLVSESIRTARDPWLVRLGRLLAYATERAPLAGQQALLAATAVLREHWATGQSPLLGPERPDPASLGRHRKQMTERLSQPAWTHLPGPAPVATVEVSASGDPLALVESLR